MVFMSWPCDENYENIFMVRPSKYNFKNKSLENHRKTRKNPMKYSDKVKLCNKEYETNTSWGQDSVAVMQTAMEIKQKSL